jgi:hypothetical protein
MSLVSARLPSLKDKIEEQERKRLEEELKGKKKEKVVESPKLKERKKYGKKK